MGGLTPADNQTVRTVFVVRPDKKIKLILIYPMTTGRNSDEVLRVIDSCSSPRSTRSRRRRTGSMATT
jgi:alkyl hydroperoxide reductase subunit AhpC